MRMAAISSAGAVARPGIANKAAEPKTARGSSRRPGAAGSPDTPGGMGRHLRARRGDLDRVPVGGGGGLVRRQSLFDRFSATGPSGMILLCRPAGSGNTVLLRSWVMRRGWRIEWGADELRKAMIRTEVSVSGR